MGEIKSALEIALEKTRDLSATDEDKRRWEEDRLERQALALAAAIRQPGAKSEEARGQLDRVPAAEREGVARRALDILFEEATPRDDPEVLARALDVLRDRDSAATRDRLVQLQKGHEETRRKRALEIAKKGLERLEARGIRGSAVVPNVETSPAWQAAEEDLAREWRDALRELA